MIESCAVCGGLFSTDGEFYAGTPCSCRALQSKDNNEKQATALLIKRLELRAPGAELKYGKTPSVGALNVAGSRRVQEKKRRNMDSTVETQKAVIEDDVRAAALAFTNKANICTHAGICNLAEPVFRELLTLQKLCEKIYDWLDGNKFSMPDSREHFHAKLGGLLGKEPVEYHE